MSYSILTERIEALRYALLDNNTLVYAKDYRFSFKRCGGD